MAITSSTIKIYSDYDLHNLIKTVTTSGATDAIDISSLDEGKRYFATVTVTDSNGLTSNESERYRFYTIPDVDFSSAPISVGTSIYYDVFTTTNDVHIARCGVVVSVAPDFTINPLYILGDLPSDRGSVDNLMENTDYYVAPYMIDEFGRNYLNIYSATLVRTTAAAPVVSLFDITASASYIKGRISVSSNATLTGLTVRLLPQGGGTYINATGYTTQTGIQEWKATGLTADTTYNIYAAASNGGGSGTDTASAYTPSVGAYVTIDDLQLNSQSETDSIYVEVSGSVSSGAVLDNVGAKVFTTNSTSGTAIADAYTQQGEANLVTTIRNLPVGTNLYVFGYVEYTINGVPYTEWTDGEEITTLATMALVSQTVGTTTCGGTYTTNGSSITSVAVKYKPTSGIVWSNATVNNGTYTITGLTAGTTYDIKGEVTNAGGTWSTATSTFTTQTAGSASFTDNGSGFLTQTKGFEIDYSVTSQNYISTINVVWSDNSTYTGANTGTKAITVTPNQTTHSIATTLTNFIPSYGQTMYVKIVMTDVQGNTFSEEFDDTVPSQSLTVYSSYVVNNNDHTFTATTSTTPTYAIAQNWVECEANGNIFRTNNGSQLTSVVAVLEPNDYAAKHIVKDIYGKEFSYEYQQPIEAQSPYIFEIILEGDIVNFDLLFYDTSSFTDAQIVIVDSGGSEIIEPIDPNDPTTWKFQLYPEIFDVYVWIDYSGNDFQSNTERFNIE